MLGQGEQDPDASLLLQVTHDISHLTCADVFRAPGVQTPVIVRFSTVIHERGSPETLRSALPCPPQQQSHCQAYAIWVASRSTCTGVSWLAWHMSGVSDLAREEGL